MKLPVTAQREGHATFRKGSEVTQVQHFSGGGRDWIVTDGQAEPVSGNVLTELWKINDSLRGDGWTCTYSTIIGMGAEIRENYFAR